MKIKQFIALFAVAVIFSVSLFAEENKTVEKAVVKENSVEKKSLNTAYGLNFAIPKYSTVGVVNGLNIGTPISINVDEVNGIDFGTFFSITNYVNGIQCSLLFNMGNLLGLIKQAKIEAEAEGKETKDFPEWFDLNRITIDTINGGQFALLFNVSKNLYGVQAAITNIIVNDANGLQLGLVNYTKNDCYGWQGAVFVNNVEKNGAGLQTSVFTNSADNYEGVQLALINEVENCMDGVQIGLNNQADKLNGVQFGLYNSSNEAEGIQFGLLNHIENGWIFYLPIMNFKF